MMSSPSELSLDCKPHSYSMLLKSIGDQTDQTQKLEEFLSRLEEERLKIDAFKRELPLCMQLLSNAVEASRQQLQTYRANQEPRPVLEEFIPLKHSNFECSDEGSKMSDKANWMTSAQLWSQGSNETKPQSTITSPKESEIGFNTSINLSPKLTLDNKQRINGGAFHPFSKDQRSSTLRALPDLALASGEKEMEDRKCLDVENGIACSRRDNFGKQGTGMNIDQQGQGGGGGNVMVDQQTTTTTTTTGTAANNGTTASQTHRKARRCWSPDLHRRFVSALQMLGGSQVATPKQIRELMKVDGLTNDEVKSHLQKYRLHTRRPSPSPQAAGAPPTAQLVVGIWVPPEYATAAAAAHGGAPPTLYGAHPTSHPSPHYCAAPQLPQEFYSAQPAPQAHHQLHHHHHHHALHHQLHLYKASPPTHSSPESEVRGNGDRSESIEDEKSESSSWKGDSGGENGCGGERKGLAALRGEGEESNGSEITLKF